jgi:hypothetical protein
MFSKATDSTPTAFWMEYTDGSTVYLNTAGVWTTSLSGIYHLTNNTSSYGKTVLGFTTPNYAGTYNVVLRHITPLESIYFDDVSLREVIPGSSLALRYTFDMPIGYVKIALPSSINPASTKYAIYDSLSQKFVMPVAGGIDSMRTGTVDSSWAWQTFNLWGAALGDTVLFPAGNRSVFQIYSKNSP